MCVWLWGPRSPVNPQMVWASHARSLLGATCGRVGSTSRKNSVQQRMTTQTEQSSCTTDTPQSPEKLRSPKRTTSSVAPCQMQCPGHRQRWPASGTTFASTGKWDYPTYKGGKWCGYVLSWPKLERINSLLRTKARQPSCLCSLSSHHYPCS